MEENRRTRRKTLRARIRTNKKFNVYVGNDTELYREWSQSNFGHNGGRRALSSLRQSCPSIFQQQFSCKLERSWPSLSLFSRWLIVTLSDLKVLKFCTCHLTCWLAESPSFFLVEVGRGCAPGTASVRINQTAVYHCAVEHKRQRAAFSTVSLTTSWNWNVTIGTVRTENYDVNESRKQHIWSSSHMSRTAVLSSMRNSFYIRT